MGRIPIYMVMKILVGSVLGFLTGLGIGGGSLLILWLTIGIGMEQSVARAINLLFFLPSALIACLFRHKQGALNFRKIFPAIVSGIVSAAFFSRIGSRISEDSLKTAFGFLLILTGIRELFYKPKNT